MRYIEKGASIKRMRLTPKTNESLNDSMSSSAEYCDSSVKSATVRGTAKTEYGSTYHSLA